MRATHHASGVPAGVPGEISGAVSAGSLGAKRSVWRCSTSTARTPGWRRRSGGERRQREAAGRPHADEPDLRDLRAVAAHAVEREHGGGRACGGGGLACGRSSVTSSRPVRSGAACAVRRHGSAGRRAAARARARRSADHGHRMHRRENPADVQSMRGARDGVPAHRRGRRPGSEAERELRVLAHLLRRPRRVERHLALDGVDALERERRTPRSAR